MFNLENLFQEHINEFNFKRQSLIKADNDDKILSNKLKKIYSEFKSKKVFVDLVPTFEYNVKIIMKEEFLG
jgi:hypothetical protein